MIWSLWNLAAWSAQVLVLVSTAGLMLRVLRLRAPRAQLILLQFLLAGCLVLPLMQPWTTPASAISVTATGLEPVPERWPVRSTPMDWSRLLLYAILAGAAARSARLALGMLRLGRYRKNAEPLAELPCAVSDAQQMTCAAALFCISREVSGPVTFGWLRPVVLMPPAFFNLSPDQQRAIACHELIHVRRRDWLWSAAEECVAAMLWFHPAIWWLIAKLRLTRTRRRCRSSDVDRRAAGVRRCTDFNGANAMAA